MPRENSFSDEDRSITPDLYPPSEPIPPRSPTEAKAPPAPLQIGENASKTPPGLKTGISATSAPASVPPPPLSPRSARPTRPTPHQTPSDKFRASVRKVIQMHRTSTAIAKGGVGAEPGVDPRRQSAYMSYGHIRQNCLIEVVDYSSVRHSFGRMGNRQFVDLMNDAKASAREPWAKVRWINIGGISWDVISAVAIRYNLHPLALEDVLSRRAASARSKCDYYANHLFLRILTHTLASKNPSGSTAADSLAANGIPGSISGLPVRSASPTAMYGEGGEWENGEGDDSIELDEKTMYGSASASKFSTVKNSRQSTMRNRWGKKDKNEEDLEEAPGTAHPRGRSRLSPMAIAQKRQRARDVLTIEELKKGERVNVRLQPMHIFLTRDGTVISFHSDPDLDFTAPISARLRQRDTGLRTSADPSLLVQSLLDLIVDQALEVVDEYHGKILKLEHDILLRPKMKTVRYLHILSGDIVLHKRTLEPIKTVIYGLRRYDRDRAAALVDTSKAVPGQEVQGYMSHKANIYLADVLDHMDFILSSLDMFGGITENLISYTFNMASYEMNEVMRRLTLATIIFLPLTLLTGYFGMNFESMWSVNQNSDLLFWEIAIPVMAVVIPIFTYPDFVKLWHYVQKKTVLKRVIKMYE